MRFIWMVLVTYLKSAGRKKRTYLVRTLIPLSAFCMALILLSRLFREMLQYSSVPDPADYQFAMSMIGKLLVRQFVVMLMIACSFLTTVYCAPVISLEREKKTLDMLTSIPINGFKIILAKVISSLSLVMFIVIGTAPLLFLALTFGGVSATEILQLLIVVVAAVFMCSGISVFVSAISKNSSSTATIIYSFLSIGLWTGIHLCILVYLTIMEGMYSYLAFDNWLARAAIILNPFILISELFRPSVLLGSWFLMSLMLCFLVNLVLMLILLGISAKFFRAHPGKVAKKVHEIRNSGWFLDGFYRKPQRKDYPVKPLSESGNPVFWKDANESMFGRRSGIKSSVVIIFGSFLIFMLSNSLLAPEIWQMNNSYYNLLSAYEYHSSATLVELFFILFYTLFISSSVFTKERSKATLENLLISGISDYQLVKGKLLAVWRKGIFLYMCPILHVLFCFFFKVYGFATIFSALFAMCSIILVVSLIGILSSALVVKTAQAMVWGIVLSMPVILFPFLRPNQPDIYNTIYFGPFINPENPYYRHPAISESGSYVTYYLLFGAFALTAAILIMLSLSRYCSRVLLREKWKGALA